LLAPAGLFVAVAAVFFDFEHPARAPIRRDAVKTARTSRGHRRRHRGGAVKSPTLCVAAGTFRSTGARMRLPPPMPGPPQIVQRSQLHCRRARRRTPLRPGKSRPTRGSLKRPSVAADSPRAMAAVRGSSRRVGPLAQRQWLRSIP
jgi:hypothetical protein